MKILFALTYYRPHISGLAHAVVEVIRHRDRFVRRREDVDKHFALAATLIGFENLFQEVTHYREPSASKSTGG